MKKKPIILSSVPLLLAVIITVSVFLINQREKVPLESSTTQSSTTTTTTTTETTTESTTEATTTTTKTTTTTTTKKQTGSKKETTTKKQSSSKPDFEYINKVTGYDGRVYYYRYDEEKDYYYYSDETGILKYAEEYVGEQVRPSKEEIYANPESKVTLYGVTWYKYLTGDGSTRYLTSDGIDTTGIYIDGLQTNGEEVVTVDGVKFYKTYEEDYGYQYYDANGNYLGYDGSFCLECGESSKICGAAMSSYHCVICDKKIYALECHPQDHYDASH